MNHRLFARAYIESIILSYERMIAEHLEKARLEEPNGDHISDKAMFHLKQVDKLRAFLKDFKEDYKEVFDATIY